MWSVRRRLLVSNHDDRLVFWQPFEGDPGSDPGYVFYPTKELAIEFCDRPEPTMEGRDLASLTQYLNTLPDEKPEKVN